MSVVNPDGKKLTEAITGSCDTVSVEEKDAGGVGFGNRLGACHGTYQISSCLQDLPEESHFVGGN